MGQLWSRLLPIQTIRSDPNVVTSMLLVSLIHSFQYQNQILITLEAVLRR